MASDGIEISDFDPASYLTEKELNPFEIAYALGKLLGEKYPSLFSTKDNIKDVDSLGFSLITACVGMKNAHSKNLHTELDKVVGTGNINIFLERIIQCVETAQNVNAARKTICV